VSQQAKTVAVVLAAGKGTRMKSELPKVLVPVAGRPMIDYVLDTLAAADIADVIVVVGYRAELVRETLANRTGVAFVEQTQQLGTGHAVMVCRQELSRRGQSAVFVLAGDSPMMQAGSLRALMLDFARRRPACLIGTRAQEQPAGFRADRA
jgi:bifunctional UDP-N-acetylglucosamine pyrophosphorylase/glucosamine-1-phosphate N-acetyltransferase/UDP-N-acetylglucosamine pyrophosphorylase